MNLCNRDTKKPWIIDPRIYSLQDHSERTKNRQHKSTAFHAPMDKDSNQWEMLRCARHFHAADSYAPSALQEAAGSLIKTKKREET